MESNWEKTTSVDNGRWTVATYEIKLNMGSISFKKSNPEDKYPTTVCYEFFDENDDLLPEQQNYRKLLSFQLDHSMRNKIHSCTLEQIKSYQQTGDEMGLQIAEKISETTNGAYKLLDFFIDYEIKGGYCLLYFQYKIKPMTDNV